MSMLPGQSKTKKGQLPGQSADELGLVVRFSERSSQTIIDDELVIIGDPAGEHVYITAEGVQVREGETAYTQVAAGVVTVGNTAGDHVYISSGGVAIRDGGTVRGSWQTDGDILIGSNVGQAADTYLAIFANNQTYNGESVAAGDMLLGDNSSGKANLFWDKSAGRLNFRGGTATAVYLDTDGALTAGDGEVTLDGDGLTIAAGSGSSSGANEIKFTAGGSQLFTLYCVEDTTSHVEGGLLLQGKDGTTSPAILILTAVNHNGTTSVNLELDSDNDRIQMTAGTVVALANGRVGDRLRVGGVSADADGTLQVSGTAAAMTLDEATSTPTAPGTADRCRLYMKADKLIVQYYDAGTVRYKYLDLTGTGVTWVHTTSAP
jgi:hypothetical protein